ncbi:hypothetical protein SprV_0501840900 [Sparganum proliferum]
METMTRNLLNMRRGRNTRQNALSPPPLPPSGCPTPQAATVSLLSLAAWNVRSLLDNPSSSRLERRASLAAWKLARYEMDTAALNETPFSEQGQLVEVGTGYTFSWSARPTAERRGSGVAFAI